MRLLKKTALVAAAAVLLAGIPAARASLGPAPDPTVPAARDTEPVILTGESFAEWAAPAEVSAKVPDPGGLQCNGGKEGIGDEQECSHNQYEEPEVATGAAGLSGVPVDRMVGFRWHEKAKRFVPIPFQVDEMAVRYLSNNNSGFSVYSHTDQNRTYVFDQERFRWTQESPDDPCLAVPRDGVTTTPDPVPGLDTDDEVVFMASDAGPAAPAGAALPKHAEEMKRVTVLDPSGGGVLGYVYVARLGAKGQRAFDASNGYVRYQPDADSDTFVRSQSNYKDYGNTYKGAYRNDAGECITNDPFQHRPKDTAWVRTRRYAFRYDGRWLMTQLQVAPEGREWEYGPDLIDQWKARAFQQRPGGETPCCGYEEEVNNWGGSSMLFGVRAGPVRVIRSHWGADSSTNAVRTEIFYRDEIRQQTNLRVHVVPPFDGIYQQWDYNAGRITRYYNPFRPDGVAVDGQNDEVFGNTEMRVGHDGVYVKDADPVPVVGPIENEDGDAVGVGSNGRCPNDACINNDVDVPDPTLSGVNPGLNYEQVSGPFGTLVHRTRINRVTGGSAYTVATVPYYRDDACFDDGTGSDPGPHLVSRGVDPKVDSAGQPRRCWTPALGDPASIMPRDNLYQGSIGTHGIHVELIADSDNAFTTVPLTEIDAEARIAVLPGMQPNVGEEYGRGTEKPLVATVGPML